MEVPVEEIQDVTLLVPSELHAEAITHHKDIPFDNC
jgi:hypothetical protein